MHLSQSSSWHQIIGTVFGQRDLRGMEVADNAPTLTGNRMGCSERACQDLETEHQHAQLRLTNHLPEALLINCTIPRPKHAVRKSAELLERAHVLGYISTYKHAYMQDAAFLWMGGQGVV